MSFAKILFSTLSIGVLALSLSISALATDNQKETPPTVVKVDEFKKNEQFRKEFGLKSDSETVKKAIDANKNLKTKYGYQFGIDLTKEEESELLQRFSQQGEGTRKIKEYVKNNIDENAFAGLWIDQEKGGIINVGIKGNIDESKMNEIKKLYTNPQQVNVYAAKYTEKELNALHNNIFDSIQSLKNEGINIVSISTNIINQTVDIGVQSLTNENKMKLLTRFNPEMVNIFNDTPVSPASTGSYYRPIQGGLRITSNEGSICSSGFSAKDSSGSYYTITAGHCAGYSGQQWYQSGGLFAYANRWSYNNSDTDAAALKIDPSNNTPEVYAFNQPNYLNLKYFEYKVSANVGDITCIAAGNSENTNCARLESTYWSGTYSDGTYHYGLFQSPMSVIPGDSGSTIYGYRFGSWYLLGVVSATGGQYTPVENIMNKLSISPVVTN